MKESLKEFAEVIKDLYLRGSLPATSGNFSLKVDDKSFFITSSGKHKGKISQKDFVLVDMEGNLAELILPIFENSQDMPELAKRVKEELKGPSKYAGFLLRSHGVYVWAKDIQRAFMKLEALEFILECELKLAIIYGGSTT
jgi:ribulose-5-phosphate 4-epimerase/fuculose-1-phosphate aldolase